MIEVTKDGVKIEIKETLKARAIWDLIQKLQNAVFDYNHLIGKSRFGDEMAFDPEKEGGKR